jgi:hypothetical protein
MYDFIEQALQGTPPRFGPRRLAEADLRTSLALAAMDSMLRIMRSTASPTDEAA